MNYVGRGRRRQKFDFRFRSDRLVRKREGGGHSSILPTPPRHSARKRGCNLRLDPPLTVGNSVQGWLAEGGARKIMRFRFVEVTTALVRSPLSAPLRVANDRMMMPFPDNGSSRSLFSFSVSLPHVVSPLPRRPHGDISILRLDLLFGLRKAKEEGERHGGGGISIGAGGGGRKAPYLLLSSIFFSPSIAPLLLLTLILRTAS